MKRILSLVLCACMILSLWGCGGHPETGETEPPLATLPDPAQALSDQSVVLSPQVDGYLESTFLADIPGQAGVALLSVRSDGTVDYIFYGADLNGSTTHIITDSLVETGFRYYTVTPEGQAIRQISDWMTQLDGILALGKEGAEGNAVWMLSFSACEGTIFIVCNLFSPNRHYQTVLFRMKDNQLIQIPLQTTFPAIDTQNDLEGQHQALTERDLRGLYNVHAAKERILFQIQGGYWFSVDYNGALAAKQVMLPENLWEIYGVGEEAAWFLNAEHSKLTTLRADDLTPIGEITVELEQVYCSAATPDGTGFYCLTGAYGSSRRRLTRYGDGGEEVLIADSDVYAFGSPACACKALAVSNDGIVYLWMEEGGRGALRQYRCNPEGAREPQIATVYSLEDNQTVRTAVILWNRTHNDYTFRYVVASDEIAGTGLTMDDAITRLNTMLVNGEGPDVLILDGMAVDSILDKGFLLPLADLDTAGVYPSLLERFSTDGTLYAVPARMTPYLLGRKMEGTTSIRSLEDFADCVEAATGKLNCCLPTTTAEDYMDLFQNALYYVEYADQVFDLWYPAWSAAIWAEGSFHPEVYQEFLTQTDRLVAHYSLQTIDALMTVYGENQKSGLTRDGYSIADTTDTNSHTSNTYPYCLAAVNNVGMRNFLPGAFLLNTADPEPISCEIVGIPGPDGSGVTVPSCMAGVRAGGMEEAAVAFVQLLLSDEVQLSAGIYGRDGYPVKWSCMPALLEQRENEEEQKWDITNDFRQALSELRPVILDEIPYDAAKEAALRFYEGKLTAQEASDYVAEKTAIYLAEQRR